MEDVVQGRGPRSSCTLHTHRVEHTATWRQDSSIVTWSADSGRELIVNYNSKNAQTCHTFDARARRRRWRRRSLVTCREDDLLRLVAISEVVCRRSHLQVIDLRLAQVCVFAQYDQICIISELSIRTKIGDLEWPSRPGTAKWPLFCVLKPNLVVFGAHCVKVVDKAITMDNLRLLCLVVNVCRGTARRPRYKYI